MASLSRRYVHIMWHMGYVRYSSRTYLLKLFCCSTQQQRVYKYISTRHDTSAAMCKRCSQSSSDSLLRFKIEVGACGHYRIYIQQYVSFVRKWPDKLLAIGHYVTNSEKLVRGKEKILCSPRRLQYTHVPGKRYCDKKTAAVGGEFGTQRSMIYSKYFVP